MTIKHNQLSFFEYISDFKTWSLLIIIAIVAFIFVSCLIMMLTESKITSITLGLFITILLSTMIVIFDLNDYNGYSVNGSAKITDIKPYSTNGNSSDNNTQTIYFTHNDHIYNIQSPDNSVIKKGDIINIKSSKYAVTIDNGTIEKSNAKHQTLNIKIHSKK